MARKRIKGGARLRDVAAAAGVSKTTASLILNGKAERYGICPATRARVEAAIRQTGYVPSQAALDMSAGRNSLVGLAIGGDKAMTDRLIASMEPALAFAGFRLLVVVLPADAQAAAARLTGLDRFGVAALAVYPAGDLAFPRLSCPVVMLGRPGAGLPAVY
jgi:LacI family transcriptional regulator, sucrose operon repressor